MKKIIYISKNIVFTELEAMGLVWAEKTDDAVWEENAAKSAFGRLLCLVKLEFQNFRTKQ